MRPVEDIQGGLQSPVQCHVDPPSKVQMFHGNILLKLLKHSYVPDIGNFASNFKAILEVLSIAIIKKSYYCAMCIPREALIDLPVNFEGYGLDQQTKTCIVTETQQLSCQQS